MNSPLALTPAPSDAVMGVDSPKEPADFPRPQEKEGVESDFAAALASMALTSFPPFGDRAASKACSGEQDRDSNREGMATDSAPACGLFHASLQFQPMTAPPPERAAVLPPGGYPAQVSPPISGTTVAQEEKAMRSDAEQSKIAELPGQRPEWIATFKGHDLKVALPEEKAAPAPHLLTPIEHPQIADCSEVETVPSEEMRLAEPGRQELLHSVREQTVLFRQLNAERMHVVASAQDGAELHLQLTRKDACIEVAALCDAAQFKSLSGQWAELKTLLAAEGIILKDLEPGRQSLDQEPGRNPRSQQQLWQETEEPPQAKGEPLLFVVPTQWQKWA